MVDDTVTALRTQKGFLPFRTVTGGSQSCNSDQAGLLFEVFWWDWIKLECFYSLLFLMLSVPYIAVNYLTWMASR